MRRSSTHTLLLHVGLFLSLFVAMDAFVVTPPPHSSIHQQQSSILAASNSPTESLLVDQPLLLDAIQSLKREAAKAGGFEQPQDDDNDVAQYAIGKLETTLAIAHLPGLDLVEAPNGMVLVSGISQEVADAGIQLFDTITAVKSGRLVSTTIRQCDLDQTATALHQAVDQALVEDVDSIQLELQRLVELHYAAE